jgi:hypothetical protein
MESEALLGDITTSHNGNAPRQVVVGPISRLVRPASSATVACSQTQAVLFTPYDRDHVDLASAMLPILVSTFQEIGSGWD